MAGKIHLSKLSPAKLRQALRTAGNVVKPAEVDTTLEYVISDGEYDLNDLYLARLKNGKVVRLGRGKTAERKPYYAPSPDQNHTIYDLMPNIQDQQLADSPTWKILAE